MSAPPPSPPIEPSPLVRQVQIILSETLGVRMRFSPAPQRWGPLAGALVVLALYLVLWWAVDAAAERAGWQRHPKFVSLLAWGGFYFAAALFFTQSATAAVIDTIQSDIEPHAERDYLAKVTESLAEWHRPFFLRIGVPVLIASVSLVAATLAIASDIERGWPSRDLLTSPLYLFWAATYFLYFLTAAQAVTAAQFYRHFARHLELTTKSFFVLRGTDSPLVVGLARLSSRVLIFWVMIFLTILSSMLLAVPDLGVYAFPPRSAFLLVLIPVAGFFSLGVGSLVYVGSEARIRSELRRFTQQRLEAIREKGNAPFLKGVPNAAQRAELKELADLHDRVVAGGKYGSPVGAMLSLALPLALPIVSVVKLIIDM